MILEGNESGYTSKDTDNKPVASVSVDQLQLAQSRLVLYLSGKLRSVHIWYVQVMVDHFNTLTYVHIIRISIQEESLVP